MKSLKRSQVPLNETWDLSLLYKSVEELYKDADELEFLSKETETMFKGKLTNATDINLCLDNYRKILCLMEYTGCYADLQLNTDFTNTESNILNDKISDIISKANTRLSFIDSELCECSVSLLKEAASKSKENSNFLLEVERKKVHILSPETEKALNLLKPTLNTAYTVYNQTKLADIRFDDFIVNGKTYPLANSLFEDNYENCPDTALRRKAFECFSETIRKYSNTTASLYNAQVRKEKAMAKLRGFDSVFDYLLFDDRIDRKMYESHLDTIMEELAPVMRRYVKILAKANDLDRMTYADRLIEFDPSFSSSVSIEKCHDYVSKGLSVLGKEYSNMIDDAFEQRWFDFATNEGKCTGGFCMPLYRKNSYILLSYQHTMSDVMTVAHELGHAGHFKLASENQSYFDVNPSGYFTESPSTMNEILLSHHLLSTSDDKRFKKWVYSNMISKTYFHNFVTHFIEAYYQREVYRIIDNGGSVQAETLNRIMRETLEKFWGDSMELTPGCELTWMRQPHYYMGLYSWTYSAGLSLATQVVKRMEKEGQNAVEDWKNALKAGGSVGPVEIAKIAGVDITDMSNLSDTIRTIGFYVDQLKDF